MNTELTDLQRERIRKLVEALRSGEYEQAHDRLRRDDRFCCLGVACDIYRKETGNGYWERDRSRIYPYQFIISGTGRGDGSDFGLPRAVQHWFGFDREEPEVELSPVIDDEGLPVSKLALSALNDGSNDVKAQNFDVIADILEANFLTNTPEDA